MHFTETMIDHMEIDSVIHHVDSEEARDQLRGGAGGPGDGWGGGASTGEEERHRRESGGSEPEEEVGR